MEKVTRSSTHEVLNQPPALVGHNVYQSDLALREAVAREEAGWADAELFGIGAKAGSAEAISWGVLANRELPKLHTFDRFGNRLDEVEYHPAWHELMRFAVEHRLHATPSVGAKSGSYVARAAGFSLWSHVDSGHGCPISMAFAAVPALRVQQELAAEWEPKLTAPYYEPGLRAPAQKKGILCGMALTEKQGGSDVRANSTRAQPLGKGGPGGEYLLTGHKWFCSAPMCDVFLLLAQAPGGLSCFLLPRVLPDGTRNSFMLQGLKDKVGNRSNASSELELDHAYARMVGEEGKGVRTIIEMVNHTRLDCVIGSSALMRETLLQALHHVSYRSAFGKLLSQQPLMKNVLADLALESEAATLTFVRLAAAYDRSASNPREAAFKRLATAVGKYWVCKRAISFTAEAMECLGGNGYVEDSMMPRHYREAPVNSIWEGSGNVNCLDVLRAMAKTPEAVDAFFQEIAKAGSHPLLSAAVDGLKKELGNLDGIEARARRIVERLALALQASLVLRHSPPAVSEAFVRSRLGTEGGFTFGTLPTGVDLDAILARARG